MPSSIASRSLASRQIAKRQIAVKLASGGAAYTVVYGVNNQSVQTWTCPKTGTYRFVQWGEGGGGGASGGGYGGGHAQTVRKISKGQTVSIAWTGFNFGNPGMTCTLTFPDGSTVVTTGGSTWGGATPGTATGGDINITGNSPTSTDGATGAGYGAFQGGLGGTGNGIRMPGIGAGATGSGGSGAAQQIYGAGLVIITQEG